MNLNLSYSFEPRKIDYVEFDISNVPYISNFNTTISIKDNNGAVLQSTVFSSFPENNQKIDLTSLSQFNNPVSGCIIGIDSVNDLNSFGKFNF